MGSDDWLDIPPAVAALPVAIPEDYRARLELATTSWNRLSDKQREYLAAWRDCRFNGRAACRRLGLSENTQPNARWMQEPDYAMVARIWRANGAADALDRDRLLARQDDIVETLLTPKPILHQGLPVFDPKRPGEVLEEVEAGAASRANEVLLQAAGVIKNGKDVEVNVGVAVSIGPPTLNIQVMPRAPSKAVQSESVAIDAKFTEVPDDEWIGT